MKVVRIETISENEFTRHFRYYDKEMDLYLSKAYDEEGNKHCLVASIPNIPSLNVMHIQFPFVFEEESERDEFFKSFDALEFCNSLYENIKEQIRQANENEKNKEIELSDDDAIKNQNDDTN